MKDRIEEILAHPLVDGARYNIGAKVPYTPEDTLQMLRVANQKHGKKLWIDLKGRQLRIEQWAAPVFGKIVLNHKIKVNGVAHIVFRGDDVCEIKEVNGNEVYVEPSPRHAVGAGQAINISGDVEIEGYLTEEDRAYIDAAVKLGFTRFMLSFVEKIEDSAEFNECIASQKEYEPSSTENEEAWKIETPKGLDFVFRMSKEVLKKIRLVAARDDLFINFGKNKAEIMKALRWLVSRDKEAVVASRIFSGIDHGGEATLADYADLTLMEAFGYQHFMLSDGLCQRYFTAAMKAWADFRVSCWERHTWDFRRNTALWDYSRRHKND